MAKLNRASLKQLQEQKKQDPTSLPGVIVPDWNPEDVTASIVHFGPSNFARAHLAKYMQELIKLGHRDVGITAVSPVIAQDDLSDEFNGAAVNRTIKRQKGLDAQDNLYGVWVKEGDIDEVEIIASINQVVVGPLHVQKVIDQMASPETKLVTMTITNDGYYYHKDQGIDWEKAGIDKDNIPQKRHVDSDPPTTTVEYVVEALEARMKAGLPSFGLMSLDNFPDNSERLMTTVLTYASLKSSELRDWIRNNTPYYTTMVDRIVPQPTGQVLKGISERIGFEDTQGLATESFMQLVIQKGRYANVEKTETIDPPVPFNDAGALYTENVKPYADTKLRMLNGAHMALGLVGRLHGETHADVALKDPAYVEFVDQYILEVSATLPVLQGIDQEEYREKILSRMADEFIHDELARLARAGESKIEGRFISPLIEAYQNDLPREYMVFALASWVKYVASANPDAKTKGDISGTETTKKTLDIADPKAYERDIVSIAKSLNGDVRPMLSIDLWKGLQNNPKFVTEFSAAYKELSGYGQKQGFGVKSTPFTPPEVA